VINSALRRDPKLAYVLALKGAACLSKNDYDCAFAAAGEALRLEPGLTAVYETRAAAYRKLGKIKEAEEDERRAGEKGVKP
jgi:tetratricopeptide (TPR) repeat protein